MFDRNKTGPFKGCYVFNSKTRKIGQCVKKETNGLWQVEVEGTLQHSVKVGCGNTYEVYTIKNHKHYLKLTQDINSDAGTDTQDISVFEDPTSHNSKSPQFRALPTNESANETASASTRPMSSTKQGPPKSSSNHQYYQYERSPPYLPSSPSYSPTSPPYFFPELTCSPTAPQCAPTAPQYTPTAPQYTECAPIAPQYTPAASQYAPTAPRYTPTAYECNDTPYTLYTPTELVPFDEDGMTARMQELKAAVERRRVTKFDFNRFFRQDKLGDETSLRLVESTMKAIPETEIMVYESQAGGQTGKHVLVGLEHIRTRVETRLKMQLEHPDSVVRRNIKFVKGVLLYGPPGTGKSECAKRLSVAMNARFFLVKAGEINQKYHGEGEKFIQTLFAVARKMQPSIIFIDEIDAIAKKRGQGGEENAVSDRLVSALIQEWEGCLANKYDVVIVVGATNLKDTIDDAVMSRMTIVEFVDAPNSEARRQFFVENLRYDSVRYGIDLLLDHLIAAMEGEGYRAMDKLYSELKTRGWNRQCAGKDPTLTDQDVALTAKIDLDELRARVRVAMDQRGQRGEVVVDAPGQPSSSAAPALSTAMSTDAAMDVISKQVGKMRRRSTKTDDSANAEHSERRPEAPGRAEPEEDYSCEK